MNKRVKNILFGVSAFAVFFTTAIGTYSALALSNVFVKENPPGTNSNKSVIDTPTFVPKENDSVLSILLLGYGGPGHDGGSLADVLMLVRVDYKSKKVALISIPRDLWVELPIRSDLKEYHKINMAHAIGSDDKNYGYKEPQYTGPAGGGSMSKYAVKKVTGIDVDYFASVSFDGFASSIDAIEGIDVDVPVSFEDKYYPIKGNENDTCGYTEAEIELFHRQYSGFELEKQFECRYETLSFEKGINHMDGATALKFVRSRHSDTYGGDFSRSQRQQAVLVAIKDKLLKLDALGNSKKFVDIFSDTIKTDVNLDVIDEFINIIGDPNDYEIKNINLNTDNVLVNSTSSEGAYILVPKAGIGNWTEVQSFIAQSLQN